MRWSIFLLFGAGTIGAAALAACGKHGNQFDNDGSLDNDGSTGDENDLLNSDGGGEGGNCRVCSSDLHSVLDCDNNVITACPPDQGCGPDGMCIPACDSARANQS